MPRLPADLLLERLPDALPDPSPDSLLHVFRYIFQCITITKEKGTQDSFDPHMDAVFAGIDWATIPVEAVGNAYEAWMERVPGALPGANQRKSSGSYYTPPELVNCLLDMALEPALEEAMAAPDPQAALLSLKVLDPSCGSGHFLLAAARRIAARLKGMPPEEAIRRVVERCIYGVDLNAVAVELCRMGLGAEGHTAVTHIQQGDALFGVTPGRESLRIPEAAWESGTGEDRAVARRFRQRHRKMGTVEEVDADTWCAAFVWPRVAGEAEEAAPLGEGSETTAAITRELAEKYRFFHWHLRFPEVFAQGGFDVILGNPPYLNQLESATVVDPGVKRFLDFRFGAIKQAYTDVATLFLVAAQGLLRPGGRSALVAPLSFFSAKDARHARNLLARGASLRSFWATTDRIFPSASVFVGAACLQHSGPRQVQVRRRFGNDFLPVSPLSLDMGTLVDEATWGRLLADLLGIPPVDLRGPPLSSLADTTADFRDQFYGLIPYVKEDDGSEDPPLIVTGLIEPAACLWGTQGCTFGKVRWERPRLRLSALLEDPVLGAWARARRVPKIVIATQTRILEAFADSEGHCINTVPTITLTPHRVEDLWHLLAVLLSPPVSAWALGRYAGAALSMNAIKLSAAQVGQIPLPAPGPSWDEAARWVQKASEDEANRRKWLVEAGVAMCRAYNVEAGPLLSWWGKRLG